MQKGNVHVSVVIPNYNGEKLVVNNLPKVLAAKNYKPNRIAEVILVDDASQDASVALIKSKFPEVKLIKHTKNRGFSAAVNTGARTAKGGLMVLLNSDVTPEKDFLVSTIDHFKNEKVFSVSLHEAGFGPAIGKFENGFVELKPGKEFDKYNESFWSNGGDAVFRRSYWMELGGMDEKLLSPYYWEDIDICYRAAKRGWLNLWEPKAKVFHEREATMSKINKTKMSRTRERNQLIFIWKNITSPNLFRKHLVGLFQRISHHPGYLRIFFMALMKYSKIRKARKKESKESKISDEAIFAKFNNA